MTPAIIAIMLRIVEHAAEIVAALMSEKPELTADDCIAIVDAMFDHVKKREAREWAIVQLGRPRNEPENT